ncbi:PilZ domain-containing protein [Pseudobacteriovorax antillogorgiicola]|uniref:PilZ domain-containing protein n=1 Tax=Pseudobacteriovorax antillogorgiicola TaxID=1513793 RepID=A0A1Y6BKZ7_9BACT|nr:PilZ domain-containing protein [Pseudobacteriovorax antillogorgiicola]TCS54671.1 PilZ domain-containing protein [Pseudobacteriovorax antillogorgiicola]SMF16703.1 PilZ domain-containing protein [Pseudobacteriovorax antillogorgiicola]
MGRARPVGVVVQNRKHSRWECDANFLPTGASKLPNKVEDKVYFRVHEVSKSGLTLLTSLRNEEALQPGMRLELHLNIPTVSNFNLIIEVIHTRSIQIDNRDQLNVGVKILNSSKRLERSIAQYLVQFSSDATLKALKEEKLIPKSIAEAVNYTTVKSEGDYQEVLNVRWQAYKSANKVDVGDPNSMRCKYDKWDRIIIAKHQGKVVSSCLLIFPGPGDQLEIEEDMNRSLDDFIPDRTKICEFTRLSALPDYRGSDLLHGMFREVARTCLAEGRDITFGSADERMAKVYEGIGYRKTGIEFYMERYKGIKHYSMIGNIRESVLSGKKVKAHYWPFLWKPLAKYLDRNHRSEISFSNRLHLWVYKAIMPILKRLRS